MSDLSGNMNKCHVYHGAGGGDSTPDSRKKDAQMKQMNNLSGMERVQSATCFIRLHQMTYLDHKSASSSGRGNLVR